MTPQEKANYLISRNSLIVLSQIGHKLPMTEVKAIAKETALAQVDTIIPIVEGYEEALDASQRSDELQWWQEVKKELEI